MEPRYNPSWGQTVLHLWHSRSRSKLSSSKTHWWESHRIAAVDNHSQKRGEMKGKKESPIPSISLSSPGKLFGFKAWEQSSVILCSVFLVLNSTLWVILLFSSKVACWELINLISLFLACGVSGISKPSLYCLFSLPFGPSWRCFWEEKQKQWEIYIC